MVRASRLAFLRLGLAAACVAAATSPLGCAKIWGIDDGLPYDDASVGGDATQPDQAAQGDGFVESGQDAPLDVADGSEGSPGDASDAADAQDAADALDAGDASDAPGEACTTDPNWCATHCDKGVDNCGKPIGCGGCSGTEKCDDDGGNGAHCCFTRIGPV